MYLGVSVLPSIWHDESRSHIFSQPIWGRGKIAGGVGVDRVWVGGVFCATVGWFVGRTLSLFWKVGAYIWYVGIRRCCSVGFGNLCDFER